MAEDGKRVRLKKVLGITTKKSCPDELEAVMVVLESEGDGEIRRVDILAQLMDQTKDTLTKEEVELMLDYYQGSGYMPVQTKLFSDEWILPDIDELKTMIGGG